MRRHRSTAEDAEPDRTDRWYVPLIIAGAVVLVLLLASVAALEVFVTRVGSVTVRDHAPLVRVDEALTRNEAQRSGNGGSRARSRPSVRVRPDHGGRTT
ncbi:MAG TPA: hypothetical protein VMR23_16735 [Candidatus Limnocylindria bacterium]|nr:hypothetical protein [Candidatus Limnocylindria bacterium]